MKKEFSKIAILICLFLSLIFVFINKKTEKIQPPKPENKLIQVEQQLEIENAAKQTKPKNPNLTVKSPKHLSYPQIANQIKDWKKEADDLVEIDTYGQTKNGKELYYIRINNSFNKTKKPVVLITACIHGNEPLATGITLNYIGYLLDGYGKNKQITELVDSRDLYFIPVVSPESYPNSRTVGDIDPNRDFPTPKNNEHQSIPAIMALREFYWKIKPAAILSGHTFGRLFMTPYGDNYGKSPHESDFNRIVGKMAEMANYKKIHCAELYAQPIDGTEVDWFYRNGSIAICAEYGTHQNIPSHSEIKDEFMRVRDALNYFVMEAPNTTVKVTDEGIDFSKNTGISRKYSRSRNGELIPIAPYQTQD